MEIQHPTPPEVIPAPRPAALSFILLLGLSRFKLVQNLLDQFIAVLRHLLADIHHHFARLRLRSCPCNSVTLS